MRCYTTLWVLVSVAIVFSGSERIGNTQITGIGHLSGGDTESFIRDVSGDGSWAVGSARDADGVLQAIRWSESSGLELLVNPTSESSQARSISRDGSTIVVSRGGESFFWDEANGLNSIGSIGVAEKLSGDGQVIVGSQSSIASRWDSTSGLQSLGSLTGSGVSEALGVSYDGSVIVGKSRTDFSGSLSDEAFIWSEATGMVGLGDLDNGAFFNGSEAVGVSDDGSVVYGSSGRFINGEAKVEAFRWTADTGMQALGFALNGTPTLSVPFAVSGNGNVLGGVASGVDGAFVWSESIGMLGLKELLELQGHDVSGWDTLSLVTEISFDGSVIVGNGINSKGEREGFVARINPASIPEPGSAALLLVAITAFLLVRRRLLVVDA